VIHVETHGRASLHVSPSKPTVVRAKFQILISSILPSKYLPSQIKSAPIVKGSELDRTDNGVPVRVSKIKSFLEFARYFKYFYLENLSLFISFVKLIKLKKVKSGETPMFFILRHARE